MKRLALCLLTSCSPSVADSPRVSGSATPASVLLASRPTLLAIADAPLSAAPATDDVSLLASCALGHDQSVTSADGVELFGETGLAPEWRTSALSRVGRRRVTACALARVSLDGLEVPVSL